MRCTQQQYNVKSIGSCRQNQGFTLLEVLVAALLFSITLLGLLNYQQVLMQQFHLLRTQQQAWQIAHSLLELCTVKGPSCSNRYSNGVESSMIKNSEWQQWVEWQPEIANCNKITARVTPLHGRPAVLQRWIC